MIRHPRYSKARLFLPDKPPCQVYDCKKMFREMRKERMLEAQRLRLRRELQRRSEQYPEFYGD
jgi:hypothetical protein